MSTGQQLDYNESYFQCQKSPFLLSQEVEEVGQRVMIGIIIIENVYNYGWPVARYMIICIIIHKG